MMNSAVPRILSIDASRIHKELEAHDVLVVAGFQGSTEDGRITTLGRGGSDTSAVALAAALDSCECEIYYGCGRGLYDGPHSVLHGSQTRSRPPMKKCLKWLPWVRRYCKSRSVEFAKKYNVPVHVRSTFSDDPGTLVAQEDAMMEAVLVSGIAYDKDQAPCKPYAGFLTAPASPPPFLRRCPKRHHG